MWLLAIVAGGAVLRIVWAVWAATPPVSFRDPAAYQMLGEAVARGDGYQYAIPDGGDVPAGLYPTAYYPPGYPLFLGVLFWLVDLLPFDVDNLAALVAANVVLSVVTIPLVFAVGRRLNGVAAGLVAAGVMAVLPNAIFHTGVALTETLFLFLLVLMLLLAVASRAVGQAPGRWRLVAIGVLFALSALVRPVSLVLLPAFLVLWWPAGVKVALRRTAFVAVAAVLVILPWTVRNAITMDSPILISANLGDNLCIGYNDDATGGFVELPAECDQHRGMLRPRFEVVRQSDNIGHAVEWALDHPTRLPGLVWWRGVATFSDDHDGLKAVQDYGAVPWMAARTERLLGSVADGVYYATLGLAILGAVAVVRRRDDDGRRDARQGFLLVTMVLAVVPPLLTFGDPRFKAPLYPLLAVYAALALVATTTATPHPEEPEPAAPTDPGTADTSAADSGPTADGAPATALTTTP